MRTQMISVSIAAVSLAIAATPVAGAASAETATVQKKAVPDKKICRLFEPPTGSLIKPRVCLTEAQWKKVDKESQE